MNIKKIFIFYKRRKLKQGNRQNSCRFWASFTQKSTHIFEKPGNQGSKYHSVIRFSIVPWHANVGRLPKLMLKLIKLPCSRADVKQDNFGVAINQPATKIDLAREKYKVIIDIKSMQIIIIIYHITIAENKKLCGEFNLEKV